MKIANLILNSINRIFWFNLCLCMHQCTYWNGWHQFNDCDRNVCDKMEILQSQRKQKHVFGICGSECVWSHVSPKKKKIPPNQITRRLLWLKFDTHENLSAAYTNHVCENLWKFLSQHFEIIHTSIHNNQYWSRKMFRFHGISWEIAQSFILVNILTKSHLPHKVERFNKIDGITQNYVCVYELTEWIVLAARTDDC